MVNFYRNVHDIALMLCRFSEQENQKLSKIFSITLMRNLSTTLYYVESLREFAKVSTCTLLTLFNLLEKVLKSKERGELVCLPIEKKTLWHSSINIIFIPSLSNFSTGKKSRHIQNKTLNSWSAHKS